MPRSSGSRVMLTMAALALLSIVGCTTGGGVPTATTPAATSVPAPVAGDAASGDVAVTIESSAFSPDPVDVKVGGSVTWTNKDSAAHTVTGEGGIASGDLPQGASYTMKFEKAGTFSYSCSIHPSMTGSVLVK